MTLLTNEWGADVIEQAERELNAEYFREDVERVKAILKSRQARWIRLTRFWSLIGAAFNELLGKSS